MPIIISKYNPLTNPSFVTISFYINILDFHSVSFDFFPFLHPFYLFFRGFNIEISNVMSNARRASEEKVLSRRKRGIIGTGVKAAVEVVKKIPKSVVAKTLTKLIKGYFILYGGISTVKDGTKAAIKGASKLKDFLFDKEGNIPDIKKDGSVVQNHATKSGGTIEFVGSLYNDEISIIEKDSNGDVLNNDIFFSNIELSREELSNKYLKKIDKPLNIEISKEDFEALKEDLYSKLPQDLEDFQDLDGVSEEELEKELDSNEEETPIENLDIVTEEELERELDTNAEEITTLEEIIDSKINTSSDIFKGINTEISIPRTNFPIGLKPTSISIPTRNYIEVPDMNEYILNDMDRVEAQMRDLPSIYTPMTYDDWAYSSLSDSYGFGSGSRFGSGGWSFGWSW